MGINFELLLYVILFITGYTLIYLFADYIIDLLEDFSEEFLISPIIAGIFILGIDLEESIVSLIAAYNGFPYLSIGNLIGNTIIAITIAFGLPALFLKFEFQEIPFFYYSILLIGGISIVISMIVPYFLFLFALMNLFMFGIHVIKSIKVQNKYRDFLTAKELKNNADRKIIKDVQESKETQRLVLVFKIFFSIVVVFIGGEMLVISAEQLVFFTGLSETFFGLIIMAFVTNVEEFWLIVKSIQKGRTELGISAQIGKILWNTTLIFGLCGLIIIKFESKTIMVFSSIIFFIILTLLVFNLIKKNFSSSTGITYFIIFIFFLGTNIFLLL